MKDDVLWDKHYKLSGAALTLYDDAFVVMFYYGWAKTRRDDDRFVWIKYRINRSTRSIILY